MASPVRSTAPGSAGSPSSDARPLVIVGPTAAGKSEVALCIARARPGTEIVVVDSMQVYRGMDIGTAKPTAAEQAEIPHHCIDLVEPSEAFAVVDHLAAAQAAAAAMARRRARPLYVGGTGLYVRAITDGLRPPPRFPAVAQELQQEPDTAALHRRLGRLDPVAARRMEPTNRRRVLRALEVTLGSGRPFSSFGTGLDVYDPTVPFRVVGIDCDTAVLDRRIHDRYHRQVDEGFVDEVRRLVEEGPPLGTTAAQALGYREIGMHLRGELSLADAIEQAVRRTRRFARRQRSWFRRDPRIEWCRHTGDPRTLVDALLCP